MSNRTGLILCHYSILGEDDVPLSFTEQAALLEQLRDAPPVPYRKADPSPSDFDTYLMLPKAHKNIEGHRVVEWTVVRDIRERAVKRADRRRGTITHHVEETDEVQTARFVAIPIAHCLAIEDRSGANFLPAAGAMSRFKSIVELSGKCSVEIRQAGTPGELDRAIQTWSISEFSFQARPFNPHPSTPGDILSDLMKADQVGSLRGTATPLEGKSIRPEDEGLVQEVVALSRSGYATYGAKGVTPSGAEASVRKPEFSQDRHRNLQRLREPQRLRIQVDLEDKDREQLAQIVRVMLEFFQPHDASDRS